MSTTQLLVRLPDDLVRRLRRRVAARERSKFIQRLLEEALLSEDPDQDPLYRTALAVEQDTALAVEMDEWENAAIGDGLARPRARKRAP